jgi:prepilin-type N-terminal cleavage/methylation domain-containing protein
VPAGGRGFTLIELMIVIAILAIISGTCVPNLMRARLDANEASAISSLRTTVSAQAMFYTDDLDGVDGSDYAVSLEELDYAGVIDDALASGIKDGYRFAITSDGPNSWRMTAEPVSPEAGARRFVVDQSGIILEAVCGNGVLETDEQCEPGSSIAEHQCEQGSVCTASCVCASRARAARVAAASDLSRSASPVAARLAAKTRMKQSALRRMATLISRSGHEVSASAQELLSSKELVGLVVARLDASGDGKLDLEEITRADILAIARSVAEALPEQGPRTEIDLDEQAVGKLLTAYQREIVALLGTGAATEGRVPAVTVDYDMVHRAAQLLELVPQPRRQVGVEKDRDLPREIIQSRKPGRQHD